MSGRVRGGVMACVLMSALVGAVSPVLAASGAEAGAEAAREWDALGVLQRALLLIWSFDGVKAISIGVALNLFGAVAVALRTGTFSARVLGEFLVRQLAPYVLIYGAFKVLAVGTDFEWVAAVVLGLIMTMVGSAIVEKLGLLGIPIPDALMQVVSRPK